MEDKPLTMEAQIKPYFNPTKPHLTEQETLNGLANVFAYPEVIRSIHDPNPNDEYALVSFIEGTVQGEIVRYIKIRGTGTKNACFEKAKKIIQQTDSRIPIATAKIGVWHQFTVDPSKFSAETIKIVDGKEIKHNDAAKMLVDEMEKKKEYEETLENTNREQRIKALSVEEIDNLKAYIDKKVMLFETNKQKIYHGKKCDLLNKRIQLLIAITKKLSKYSVDWYNEYLSILKKVGINNTEITEEIINELETLEDVSLQDITLEELNLQLTDVTNAFNNLKY